jgi:fructose-bisphosphate aldolase class I
VDIVARTKTRLCAILNSILLTMDTEERTRNIFALKETVQALMAKGKGILALDESLKTAGKRLASVGLESTEENRRRYRELFLGTVGIDKYLSGVILPDEGMWQASRNGVPFPKLLTSLGVIPGVKVDGGLAALPNFEHEQYATGLDGLPERLAKYREGGARFAKWRAAYTIDVANHLPSDECIELNAINMAIYALECQKAGIVPIVEPEVLLDGNHSMETAARITEHVIRTTMAALARYRVDRTGVILKTSMVVPGIESAEHEQWKQLVKNVAEQTVETLKRSVPNDIGGVVFLSGGQSPDEATAHFDAIAEHEPLPWQLAFSFARALQQDAMNAWQGSEDKVSMAREAFIRRLELCTKADVGDYDLSQEVR